MNENIERNVHLEWKEPNASYDVIIIGGGGHGLATAYYLATRHGITNVAVVERKYIGAGNSGRNTTIIRANYGIPEAVRFYQRSVELYAGLENETNRKITHKQKGLLTIAHSEAGIRTERARTEVNKAFGAETVYIEPDEIIVAAAKVGGIHANSSYPAEFIYENLVMATNIIHAAYKYKVKKLGVEKAMEKFRKKWKG